MNAREAARDWLRKSLRVPLTQGEPGDEDLASLTTAFQQAMNDAKREVLEEVCLRLSRGGQHEVAEPHWTYDGDCCREAASTGWDDALYEAIAAIRQTAEQIGKEGTDAETPKT